MPFIPNGPSFFPANNQSGHQNLGDLTALVDGNYVAVWCSADGYMHGQVLNASGGDVGGEFVLNAPSGGIQAFPAITALSGGGFVTTWWDENGANGDGNYGIEQQLFTATGLPVGGNTLVNTLTNGVQQQSAVTALQGGGYMVSWTSYYAPEEGAGGSGTAIKAQVFDSAGVKVGTEFLVNTTTSSDQAGSSLTTLGSGNVVAVWADNSGLNGDTSDYGLVGQILSSTGNPIGGEFLINTETAGDQVSEHVTSLASGGFVVTWSDIQSTGHDSSASGVKAQIFDASGTKVGGEIAVNTTTEGGQDSSHVAALPNGGFVIAWQGGVAGGVGSDIVGQQFSASGEPVGGEFIINSTLDDNQVDSSLISLANGDIVASWTDFNGDGDGWGLAVRTFSFVDNVTVYDSSSNLVGSFATIQAAVDAASNGYSIHVAAGTYQEQVIVDGKTVSIVAAPGAILESPDHAALTSAGNYGVLAAINGAHLNVTGLAIDGRQQGTGFGDQQFAGVSYIDSDGAFTNGSITGFTNATLTAHQHG